MKFRLHKMLNTLVAQREAHKGQLLGHSSRVSCLSLVYIAEVLISSGSPEEINLGNGKRLFIYITFFIRNSMFNAGQVNYFYCDVCTGTRAFAFLLSVFKLAIACIYLPLTLIFPGSNILISELTFSSMSSSSYCLFVILGRH